MPAQRERRTHSSSRAQWSNHPEMTQVQKVFMDHYKDLLGTPNRLIDYRLKVDRDTLEWRRGRPNRSR